MDKGESHLNLDIRREAASLDKDFRFGIRDFSSFCDRDASGASGKMLNWSQKQTSSAPNMRPTAMESKDRWKATRSR